MLKLPSLGELDREMSVHIYLCVAPTDMRRGFDTLAASVKEFLGQDPFSGNLFLFVGRGKDRLKILYWEKDGFCLWYKVSVRRTPSDGIDGSARRLRAG
jgi:transposase